MAENNITRTLQIEREKHRQRVADLTNELQDLRRESKAKDLQLFEMEDEVQAMKTQLREQYLQEKKKSTVEWEERLRSALNDRSIRQQQNDQLRELITRQHKALQLQNDQYEECAKKNEEMAEALAELQEQLAEMGRMKIEAQERASDLTEIAARMEAELEERRNGASAKEQIQELRKRLGELAKDELEKIEFIVNE